MKKTLLVFLMFLSIICVPGTFADSEDVEDDDDEQIFGVDAEDLGSIAQAFLIFTISIVLWKPSYRYVSKRARDWFDDPKEAKKKIRLANKIYMRLHYWIGLFALIIGGVHGLGYLDEQNQLLYWSGWFGMLLLTVSGSLLLWKWPPKEVKKGARLIHAQRAILLATIVLLIISHGFD